MASKQSLANKSHYETLAAVGSKGPMSPEENVEWNERHWPALTAKPRGINYIEANAGPIPSMWIVPKGATEDRVIRLGPAASYRRRKRRRAAPDISADEHKGSQRSEPGNRPPWPNARPFYDGCRSSRRQNRHRVSKDLFFAKEAVAWLASNMLGESGDRRDPLASPLYANFKGLPPIYLQAGSDETLVDDSRMLAEKARQAGVEVRLDVFPEMLHTFQMMAGYAPEADDAIARLAEWVRPKLGLDDKQRTAA
jgi:hypothetical protein